MSHIMSLYKPMLACDWDPKKLCFPLWQQPKIDGVRALNLHGRLTGRSLKEHGNRSMTEFFSNLTCEGMDGEMIADAATNTDLCRITTSAVSTRDGDPYTQWWLFDLINIDTVRASYSERYAALEHRIMQAKIYGSPVWSRLRLVPYKVVYSLEEIQAIDDVYVSMGYEGSILRNPIGPYKSGRCTPRESNLLRIKRFVDKEFRITGVEEGETNLNEAKTNELGQIERSTHQAGMVPNGMVGTLLGVDLETGQDIRVAAGRLTHADRAKYLAHPELIIGKIGKYKTFEHGVKDKPRFSPFQCFRAESDMS